MELGRIGTAMVTPFTVEGSIDFDQAENIIEHLLRTGTDFLVVNGTTGESPTLTEEEKKSLLKHTVEVVNHRVPVIMGTGSFQTADSIVLTKDAEQLGADGVMLVTPYYNKPDQKGLYTHFSTIAAETSLPVMLYNIPGRSAVHLEVETVVALSHVKNIRSIKEASGNLEQMAAIIAQTDDQFTLYSGDDSLTLPSMAIGANGVISVAAHVVGQEIQQMMAAFLAGRVTEAAQQHRLLLPVFKGLFAAPSPVPVKYALEQIGLSTGGVRLPLVNWDADEAQKFDAIWAQFKQAREKIQL